MKKRWIFPLFFGIMVLTASCASDSGETTSGQSPQSETQNTAETQKKVEVVVAIHNGQEDNVLNPSLLPGQTLLEVMENLSKEELQVDFKEYAGLGTLLTGIDGVRNDDEAGAYWVFCLNEYQHPKGMKEVELQGGEKIDWHYTKGHSAPCKQVGE